MEGNGDTSKAQAELERLRKRIRVLEDENKRLREAKTEADKIQQEVCGLNQINELLLVELNAARAKAAQRDRDVVELVGDLQRLAQDTRTTLRQADEALVHLDELDYVPPSQ